MATRAVKGWHVQTWQIRASKQTICCADCCQADLHACMLNRRAGAQPLVLCTSVMLQVGFSVLAGRVFIVPGHVRHDSWRSFISHPPHAPLQVRLCLYNSCSCSASKAFCASYSCCALQPACMGCMCLHICLCRMSC